MGRLGINIATVVAFSALSAYGGVTFFKPLIIEQLRKDGNLRDDIGVPVDTYEEPTWDKVRENATNMFAEAQAMREAKDKAKAESKQSGLPENGGEKSS